MIPEVEIRGTNLGLKTVVDVVRDIFKRHPKHIGGDVVIRMSERAEAANSDRVVKNPVEVSVYFLQGRGGSQSLSSIADGDDVEGLVQTAAELALRQVNPFILASSLNNRGEYTKAKNICQAITQDSPQDREHKVAAFDLWGNVLMSQGSNEEAIAKSEKALAVDPTYAPAYNGWGLALKAEKKSEEAIAKYEKALELDPKYVIAYNGWGVALKAEDKYDEAIAKYQMAVELNPKYTHVYDNWGLALEAEGKSDEAIAKFEEASEADPKAAYVYNDWADALLAEGKNAEAITKCQKVIELSPRNAAAYKNWGTALQKLGKQDEAAEKFAKVQEFSSGG